MWWWRTAASDRRGRRRLETTTTRSPLGRGHPPYRPTQEDLCRQRAGMWAPRVPSGALLTTRPWTSGPTAPPGVGAGTYHGERERTDDNGYGQPEPKSRTDPQHPPDRRTYAFRVGCPTSGARGAPSPRQPATGRSTGSDRREGLAGGSRFRDAGRGGPSPMRGSRPARRARCASRRRQPFDEYDAPGRPPVQAPPAMGGMWAPGCRPAPASLLDPGPPVPRRLPESARGRTKGERTDGRQWAWTVGTEKPKEPRSTHRIDVLTRSRRPSPS